MNYRAGDSVPPFTGIVKKTRRDNLRQLAQLAFLDRGLTQEEIIIGGKRYPNPLFDYDAILNRHISAMSSIIHGDLVIKLSTNFRSNVKRKGRKCTTVAIA